MNSNRVKKTGKKIIKIDYLLDKKIKNLSTRLGMLPIVVLRRAIEAYEINIINTKKFPEEGKTLATNLLHTQYDAATVYVWATDLKSKRIQQQLMQGSETIDDFILNDWSTGLGR